ncbi:hypothetical protein [Stutzerimonas nitrititolerans]|uniref:hypothetical protein n=1 Tax=Stutzerimonas nitrititolerans TaxID=2482751 RepID=UPI00289EC239|nr:hypothetical protein [Stutzerimonas nitrititolerans]
MNTPIRSGSMSLMKDLTPAILSAAVGIMASYSTASSADTVRQATSFSHQQSQEDVAVANAIHALIKECGVMEQRTRAAIKEACAMPTSELAHLLNASELSEFEEYVQQLRDLETLLKTIEVPEQFEGLHANLRRALAKGRSSLVLLQDLTLQAMKSPVVVPGVASPVAIRALAEHTTKRLVELANA